VPPPFSPHFASLRAAQSAGSGYPLQALSRYAPCGLSASIPHAYNLTSKFYLKIILKPKKLNTTYAPPLDVH